MIIHKPIQFKDISLVFPHKICFKDFNAQIYCGDRIAIIGRNGSGKSTLLKMLQGLAMPTDGMIHMPEDVQIGYVPQVISSFDDLSGGQRFNAALTQALSKDPNLLLLDEPTNHLDKDNRKSLLRMLKHYTGTLVVVTHDIELLNHCVDTIWHIDNGKISIFNGNYHDYMREMQAKRQTLESELEQLERQKRKAHELLMKEQERAKHSRERGEKSIAQRKWPTVVSTAKARRAEETSGRKKSDITSKKEILMDRLSELRLPDIIKPTFSISPGTISSKILVSIREASVGYYDILVKDINLSLTGNARIAIMGANGSGKSTLLKAILNPTLRKAGHWHVPKQEDMGYLDQHYSTLEANKTVLQTLEELVPDWTPTDIRRHLMDFLFRKNEEVNAMVSNLSGGERARLSLACIAAKTPKLLLLDEITNNLDLESIEHVIQVLKEYPGALIIISHNQSFMDAINITDYYKIEDQNFHQQDPKIFSS